MFTSAARERVLAIVVKNLAPYVGATMASASVNGFSARLKLDAAQLLDRQKVQMLLDALAPGLDVYVGKDKARALLAEIWAALDAMEPKR